MNITDLNIVARRWSDSDTTSHTAANLLIDINQAYETVVSWLINADGTWQFDDTNYTDFPIGTYTLVNAQGKYSFNDQFLQMMEVQILDKAGNYRILQPIDQKEFDPELPLERAFQTAGLPIYYDKISDDTIKLFPAPDNGVSVTLASGLKIKFKRTASLYTAAEVTTGTKTPGFASPFHIILAYMAARVQCMLYKKDRVPELNALIGDTTLIPTGMKKDLIRHYSTRQKDQRKKMSMATIQFR